jgi:hypothetical protein
MEPPVLPCQAPVPTDEAPTARTTSEFGVARGKGSTT